MAYESNAAKDNERGKSIQVLIEVAENIAACGKDIQEAAENITLLYQIPGLNGETYKDLLLVKIHNLRRLAALCKPTSIRLMTMAEKLVEGISEDGVVADMLVYSLFLNDQLEYEGNELNRVLRMIPENHDDTSNLQIINRGISAMSYRLQ